MSIAAVDREHRVTPRELFFDLVFVFAFTQVAILLADDPTFAGIGRSVLVLAVLWCLAPWTLLGATLILVAGFAAGARTWLSVAARVRLSGAG